MLPKFSPLALVLICIVLLFSYKQHKENKELTTMVSSLTENQTKIVGTMGNMIKNQGSTITIMNKLTGLHE